MSSFRHPWRLVAFVSTVAWVAVLLAAVILDPTAGHGKNAQTPPLWGWWISSLAVVPVAGLGRMLWNFGAWAFAGAFERSQPEGVQERIARLERELGIKT